MEEAKNGAPELDESKDNKTESGKAEVKAESVTPSTEAKSVLETEDDDEGFVYIDPTPVVKKKPEYAENSGSADADKSSVKKNVKSADEKNGQSTYSEPVKTAEDKDDASESTPRRHRKKMSKKAKKAIKWIIILVVIGLGIYIYLQYTAYKLLFETDIFNSTSEQAVVERRDLQSTISTTGTIQSKDVRTLTSALSGVTIEEVNYEVGDMVEEGAVVVTFSKEDIDKKMAELSDDISKAKQTQALDAANRDTNYNYNYGSEVYTLSNASVKTQQAYEDLMKAQEDLGKACGEKSDYLAKYEEAVANKDALKTELEEVQKYYKIWSATNNSPLPEVGNDDFVNWGWLGENNVPEYYWYLTTTDAWNNHINELNTKVTEYENTIKNYDSQISSLDRSIESAQNSVNNAQRNYDSALTSENKTNYDSANNLKKYDYNYAKENLSAGDNVENLERQYTDYEEKLGDYIVKAPITGLVTAVNAQEGNGYQANTGALMTIQAIDSFEVTTQIDEYDINSVQVGQRVVIRTDATGDEDIDGVVSFISPTATTGQSGATSSSGSTGNTFEVKIDVNSADSRLKLGMSAKLNIITDSHDNVLTVRYDAIEEKSNGEHVVYVIEGDNAKKGKKNDFVGGKPGKESGEDGILVVGVDGSAKVTGTPESESNPDFGDDGKKPDFDRKDGKMSFIKYLFSSDKGEKIAETEGTFNASKEVVVTVGIEGDYYTEISSPEITEGTVLMVNSQNGEMQNAFMQMFGGGMGGPGDAMGGGPRGF